MTRAIILNPDGTVDTRDRETSDADAFRDLQRALARFAAGDSDAQCLHAFLAGALDFATRTEHRAFVATGLCIAIRKGWLTGEKRP